MARGDQLSRQWKIIQSLLAASKGKSASELAKTLGCHSRTVYRDLEALQLAGFPLYTEKSQGRTLWSILDNGRQQMPMPLDLTELMALYFSRNMLNIMEGSAIHQSLVSLFEKVKATLPEAYTRYLEKMESSLQVGIKAHKTHQHFQQALSAVQEAVQRQCRIDIEYFTMSRNASSSRRVAPYKVWFYDETFYMIGYCQLRKEIRLFAIDRIKSIALSDDRFEMPDGFDAERFMHKSFGVFQGEPVKVSIRFSPQAAGYIKEKIWHPSQILEPESDGAILFTAEVAGIEEIKRWVMKWGSAAQVLEPASLRDEIATEARKMVEYYATIT
jgi:predicted DNA-binding transcriptional regulator YafY